jgi:aminomethyltransferase
MDDVTLTDRSDAFAALAIEGPKAVALVQRLTGIELSGMDDLETREVMVSGTPARVGKRSPGGRTAAEFLVGREKCAELWGALEEVVRTEGGCPAGYKALNSVRLEMGIPWFGYDFGEKQIPHEAGLQDSHISYTKGCYTGQEIVERVRSRGQVNRVRVSLKFEGPIAPEANAPLSADGKEIGFVTRVGFSPALNAWIGMGYVRREKSTAGSALTTSNGTARVIQTPLA